MRELLRFREDQRGLQTILWSSVTIYGVEMGKHKHKSLKTDKASYKTDRKKERSKRSRKKKKRVDRKKHKGHKEHGEWKSLVY